MSNNIPIQQLLESQVKEQPPPEALGTPGYLEYNDIALVQHLLMQSVVMAELEEQEDPLVSGSPKNNDEEEETEPKAEAGEVQQQSCNWDSNWESVFSVINVRRSWT